MKNMELFREIKKEYEEKYNQELNKTGIFFAFSNEQFEKNRTYKGEEGKYISTGMGGYVHEKDEEKIDKFFNETIKELENEFLEKIKDLKDEHILYELLNHECFYTYSLSSVEFLKSFNYSDEDIIKVFNDNKSKYDN